MTKENEHLQEENETLLTINEAFSRENDELCAELKRYHSFHLPKSMQHNHVDLTNDELLQFDDESDDRATKHHKTGFKEKKPVHHTKEEESDLRGARVCNLSNVFINCMLYQFY